MMGFELMQLLSKQGAKEKESSQNNLFEYSQEFQEAKNWWTLPMMDMEFKKMGKKYSHSLLLEQLERLAELKYVEKEKKGNLTAFRKFIDVPMLQNTFDWQKCLESGKEVMKREFPDQYDEWLKYNTGTLTDVFNNTELNISDFKYILKPLVEEVPIQNNPPSAKAVEIKVSTNYMAVDKNVSMEDFFIDEEENWLLKVKELDVKLSSKIAQRLKNIPSFGMSLVHAKHVHCNFLQHSRKRILTELFSINQIVCYC